MQKITHHPKIPSTGYILVAVSIGAFLGALTVLFAARRGAFGAASVKRSSSTSNAEPDAVDPVTPADVSVQLSALGDNKKGGWFCLVGEYMNIWLLWIYMIVYVSI